MDDLTKRLRDASPHARRTLPDSAEALMRDIIEGHRVPRDKVADDERVVASSRTMAVMPLLSAAGAMLVVLLVVLVVAIDRPAAVAATPDPLAVHATSWTLSTLRNGAEMPDKNEVTTASRLGASYEGWYLQTEEGADHGLIQPQLIISEAGPKGTGTTLVLAGNPITPDGWPVVPTPASASPPGSVLSETNWTIDDYASAFPTPPPDTAEAMRMYLLEHLRLQGAELQMPVAAGDYLIAAVTLLQTWTLDDQAQRALLKVLLNAPGLRVVGDATDRAGRLGVVLDIAPGALGNPAFHERLVIDPTHWRVLAVESTIVDGILQHQVPAGAVTSYTLWR